ncbi:MAG: PHP domain-containing protein, partial [Xanthomonadales bacterium]|nr:PHP domain-containing protein [Xanthomonadales bacterium]
MLVLRTGLCVSLCQRSTGCKRGRGLHCRPARTPPSMSTAFVHLRIHSEYSLVDSTVRIGALVKAAAAAGMPALALTDESNLFGLVK